MLFRQMLHEPLSAASYLIGCPSAGVAAVIDPSLAAEQYVLLAADRGLRITAILETHMHADYLSNGRALAGLTGAQLYLPRGAGACFPHQPIDDGWQLWLGSIGLRALHTPGHTPEHTAFIVAQQGQEDDPWCVLTGDCLFAGDVGRADLLDLPQSGAAHLHTSLQRLLALPATSEIYPAHYGGSSCGGRGMSGKPSSTIGYERRHNRLLGTPNLATFTAMLDETPRLAVDAVLHNRNTNRGELPLPEGYGQVRAELKAVRAFTPHQAGALLDAGSALIDLRDRLAFTGGYVVGALSSSYGRDTLAGRVAALAAPEVPLLLIADLPFLARFAASLLAAVGRNPVQGFVDATPEQWQQVGRPFAQIAVLSVEQLHEERVTGATQILDVRAPFELEQGRIAGALAIPFGEVRERIAEIPRGRRIVVVCESGIRAVGIASLLARQGFGEVAALAPQGVSEYLKRFPSA